MEKSKRSKNKIEIPKYNKILLYLFMFIIFFVFIKKKIKNVITNNIFRISRGTSTTEDNEYKSPYLTKPVGPNPDLPKGANNDLLL